MKKKLLLGILPALMVLSACSGAGFKIEDDLFKESTDACQDIFGRAEIAGELKGRRNSTSADLLPPVIGVQYKVMTEDDPETTEIREDRYAIRFIAAIASLDIDAYWTRGVSQVDSNQIRALSNSFKVSTAYTALDGAVSPSEYAGDVNYKYYVTYSMYNIPNDQLESYMVAYLTIEDTAKALPSVKSEAKITQIKEGGKNFNVSADKNAYFYQGVIGGETKVVDLDAGSGTDHGQKLDYPLLANDEFGCFLLNSEHFQFFGATTFNEEPYYFESSAGDYYHTRAKGTYDFYLNEYNQLYASCDTADITLYLKLSDKWASAEAAYAVYYNDDKTFNRLTLIDAENHIYKIDNYDFVAHPYIIFTRHNPASDPLSWADGNKWNQTRDISYVGASAGKETGTSDPSTSMYTVNNDAWDYSGGTWSTYVA